MLSIGLNVYPTEKFGRIFYQQCTNDEQATVRNVVTKRAPLVYLGREVGSDIDRLPSYI